VFCNQTELFLQPLPVLLNKPLHMSFTRTNTSVNLSTLQTVFFLGSSRFVHSHKMIYDTSYLRFQYLLTLFPHQLVSLLTSKPYEGSNLNHNLILPFNCHLVQVLQSQFTPRSGTSVAVHPPHQVAISTRVSTSAILDTRRTSVASPTHQDVNSWLRVFLSALTSKRTAADSEQRSTWHSLLLARYHC
jgi:hypothetical protein